MLPLAFNRMNVTGKDDGKSATLRKGKGNDGLDL